MLKVVIIDDEQIQRDGMKTIIEWESYGFCIVGEANNGFSGIQVVQKEKPDIVLVDVKMPEMSGIEMISNLKENNVRAKFIILSGYSDFAYTKKAILLGVDAYLLKPLEEDELINLLKSIREKIKEENVLEGYLEKGKQFTLNDFIIKTIESTYENKIIPYSRAEIETRIGPPNYSVAIINITSGSAQLNEQVVEFLQKRGIFAYARSEVVAVLSLKSNQTGKQKLTALLSQMKCLKGIHMFVVLGSSVKASGMINVSFKEAKELMLNKFLFSHLSIVSPDDFSSQKENDEKKVERTKTIFQKMTVAVQIMDMEYISVGIQELKKEYYSGFYSESEIKSCFCNLLVSLLSKASVKTSSTEYINSESALEMVYSMNNLDELLKYVECELNRLANVLGDMSADTTIKRVGHYVERNYNNRLTLDILGVMFGYSSVYLGKIFKQYTGVSFNQYLEKLRINEAKKMLSGDMKVYQIAEKVGFSSNDYFCSIFKRSEGLSPTEYKQNMQDQADDC